MTDTFGPIELASVLCLLAERDAKIDRLERELEQLRQSVSSPGVQDLFRRTEAKWKSDAVGFLGRPTVEAERAREAVKEGEKSRA